MRLFAILACAALAACSNPDKPWVRSSPGCVCDVRTGLKCKCNHCLQEEMGRARCYCGEAQAGCACGRTRPSCDCKHCRGVDGACNGKGQCICPK